MGRVTGSDACPNWSPKPVAVANWWVSQQLKPTPRITPLPLRTSTQTRTSLHALERAEEVQDVLLVGGRQQVEVADHRIRFRSGAGMSGDDGKQILGAAVMQEEDALADAPERGGTELGA